LRAHQYAPLASTNAGTTTVTIAIPTLRGSPYTRSVKTEISKGPMVAPITVL
jgi:hypothetical protein